MIRQLLTRNSDAMLALFVVAVAMMLLIPLPTPLLDLLLALNISFALLLLLVGLYMPNALALLAFPALLLLTTLFRLSLNVASTRLILSRGEAGRVIEAFGMFLIGGELVVGMVIFTIITIVNFIVIARGATRVSEVAARFALDALPGKQMAIDADLRAGLMSAEEARRRRDDLRKESQLYGAMDGAMKFVQGDAIAGFFIIITNILGGLYMGVHGGMGLGDALQRYTLLTVGDGLVSQIPALLISICAGIVVTRVSSGENRTLGSELGMQLFQSPFLLYAAGGIVLLIGLLPGLPFIPFLVIAVLFAAAGRAVKRSGDGSLTQLPMRRELTNGPIGLLGADEMETGTKEQVPLGLALDAAVLFRLYQNGSARHHAVWSELQSDFFETVGIRLPELAVTSDDLLPAAHYSFSFRGAFLVGGRVPVDAVLVEMNPAVAESFGIEPLLVEHHPVSGQMVFWSRRTPMLERVTEAGKIRLFDFMEYVFLSAASFLRSHPEEVVSITDVHACLKQMQQKYPGLITDAFNSEFINASRLTKIVHELIREGLSVRDFRLVVESTASYCSTYGLSMVREDDFDVQDIVTYIRLHRRRQTLSRLLSPRGTVKVFTLDPTVEEVFENMKMDVNAVYPSLEQEVLDALRGGLRAVVDPMAARGLLPVAVLCSPDLRHKVSSFLRVSQRFVGVVTSDELDPELAIEPAGVWEI